MTLGGKLHRSTYGRSCYSASRPLYHGYVTTDASNYYLQNANVGEPQGADGMTMAILFVPLVSDFTSNEYLVERLNATGGFASFVGANEGIRFQAANGVGTTMSASVSGFVANQVNVLHGRHDGSFVRAMLNGNTGTENTTAIVGYTAPGSSPMGYGIRDTKATPASDVIMLGFAYTNASISDAQIANHIDAIRSARRMKAFPAGAGAVNLFWDTGYAARNSVDPWPANAGTTSDFEETGAVDTRSFPAVTAF